MKSKFDGAYSNSMRRWRRTRSKNEPCYHLGPWGGCLAGVSTDLKSDAVQLSYIYILLFHSLSQQSIKRSCLQTSNLFFKPTFTSTLVQEQAEQLSDSLVFCLFRLKCEYMNLMVVTCFTHFSFSLAICHQFSQMSNEW